MLTTKRYRAPQKRGIVRRSYLTDSGGTSKRACFSSPSSAVKHDAESKRQAQPVHRAVAADQGGRLQVTDQRVILDLIGTALGLPDSPEMSLTKPVTEDIRPKT